MRRHLSARATGVLCTLTCCALLSNCGGGNSLSPTQGQGGSAKLKQIQIAPANKTIGKGTHLQFSATGLLSDGTQQSLSSSVKWQVSPSNVATITAQGNLTGAGEGIAKVSAVYQGLTGSTSVTVGAPVLISIAVSAPQSSLPVGESESLTAIGNFSDGSTQSLTQWVAWRANPSAVANISAQGKLTGVGKGVAQVSAAYQGLSGDASVTVGSAALVGIAVSAPQSSLPLGESESLTATGNFSDGSTQNLTQSVAWQTNPSTVALISTQGNLTGVGKGVAQVSAVYQGLSGNTSVTVGSAILVSIAVNMPQSSLPLGESEPVTATGNFSDGTMQNLTQVAAWGSSAPAIAGVSSAGAVAKAVGTAALSASVGSVTGTANLTVTTAAAVALTVTPATLSLLLGNSGQLQAIATFSDGTTQDVTGTATWTSEQPATVGVSSGGLLTAEQIGSATILAESSGLTTSAAITVAPLMTVSYFNRANAVSSRYDGTVRLINPGFTAADLCAMIYVFDDSQELNECCACKISDSGLRTLSLIHDLTANTLTGRQHVAGSIEIVSSDPDQNGLCNAASLAPDGMIAGWETNVQGSTGAFQVTETTFATTQLSDTEAQVLATGCGAIQQLGSGAGICTCGIGN
jgi:Big-like domain-containing protein